MRRLRYLAALLGVLVLTVQLGNEIERSRWNRDWVQSGTSPDEDPRAPEVVRPVPSRSLSDEESTVSSETLIYSPAGRQWQRESNPNAGATAPFQQRAETDLGG